MLDTHTCFISFIALPDRPLQSTMEPRSRSTLTAPFTTSSSPLTRSSSEVPRQEASPFDPYRVVICASPLRAYLCSRVCTQILLLPLTLCFRAVIFEPSWPLACIIQLVLSYVLELCCDIIPCDLDHGRVPCVYDYCT